MTWGEMMKFAIMATLPALLLLASMYYGMVITGDAFHDPSEFWR
jgi:hypothetical protein